MTTRANPTEAERVFLDLETQILDNKRWADLVLALGSTDEGCPAGALFVLGRAMVDNAETITEAWYKAHTAFVSRKQD